MQVTVKTMKNQNNTNLD